MKAAQHFSGLMFPRPDRGSPDLHGSGKLEFWATAAGATLALAVVDVIVPTAHALSYACLLLIAVGALGWALDLRTQAEQAAAPDAVVAEQGDADGEYPSAMWSLIVALGVTGVLAGLVFRASWLGEFVAVPLTVCSFLGWSVRFRQDRALLAQQTKSNLLVVDGKALTLATPEQLVAKSAQGDVIVREAIAKPGLSRRRLLQGTFWLGFGGAIAAAAGTALDLLYPRGVVGFGGIVSPGVASKFPAASKTQVEAGHFWLANLTPEQGGDGYLALWWRCPHLGCTVPWRPDFSFTDPVTGVTKKGWFRCPCHGSTYTDAGVRVFGPAPRSMDHMKLTIDSSQKISVDTGKITKGTVDNAKYCVKA